MPGIRRQCHSSSGRLLSLRADVFGFVHFHVAYLSFGISANAVIDLSNEGSTDLDFRAFCCWLACRWFDCDFLQHHSLWCESKSSAKAV